VDTGERLRTAADLDFDVALRYLSATLRHALDAEAPLYFSLICLVYRIAEGFAFFILG
jgi:hypothetical protein